ncbi:hypothetical protein CLOM_g5785 [Closterium sp. NIES-68]|nr:hypothetical protein CLOM_g5785 [Closterium sp. NIES-68]GJP73838.1 hypothetical protein CLOP_g4516 [Closterium sp. NIES-67]
MASGKQGGGMPSELVESIETFIRHHADLADDSVTALANVAYFLFTMSELTHHPLAPHIPRSLRQRMAQVVRSSKEGLLVWRAANLLAQTEAAEGTEAWLPNIGYDSPTPSHMSLAGLFTAAAKAVTATQQGSSHADDADVDDADKGAGSGGEKEGEENVEVEEGIRKEGIRKEGIRKEGIRKEGIRKEVKVEAKKGKGGGEVEEEDEVQVMETGVETTAEVGSEGKGVKEEGEGKGEEEADRKGPGVGEGRGEGAEREGEVGEGEGQEGIEEVVEETKASSRAGRGRGKRRRGRGGRAAAGKRRVRGKKAAEAENDAEVGRASEGVDVEEVREIEVEGGEPGGDDKVVELSGNEGEEVKECVVEVKGSAVEEVKGNVVEVEEMKGSDVEGGTVEVRESVEAAEEVKDPLVVDIPSGNQQGNQHGDQLATELTAKAQQEKLATGTGAFGKAQEEKVATGAGTSGKAQPVTRVLRSGGNREAATTAGGGAGESVGAAAAGGSERSQGRDGVRDGGRDGWRGKRVRSAEDVEREEAAAEDATCQSLASSRLLLLIIDVLVRDFHRHRHTLLLSPSLPMYRRLETIKSTLLFRFLQGQDQLAVNELWESVLGLVFACAGDEAQGEAEDDDDEEGDVKKEDVGQAGRAGKEGEQAGGNEGHESGLRGQEGEARRKRTRRGGEGEEEKTGGKLGNNPHREEKQEREGREDVSHFPIRLELARAAQLLLGAVLDLYGIVADNDGYRIVRAKNERESFEDRLLKLVASETSVAKRCFFIQTMVDPRHKYHLIVHLFARHGPHKLRAALAKDPMGVGVGNTSLPVLLQHLGCSNLPQLRKGSGIKRDLLAVLLCHATQAYFDFNPSAILESLVAQKPPATGKRSSRKKAAQGGPEEAAPTPSTPPTPQPVVLCDMIADAAKACASS